MAAAVVYWLNQHVFASIQTWLPPAGFGSEENDLARHIGLLAKKTIIVEVVKVQIPRGLKKRISVISFALF